jgi:hypothetical protein
MTKDTLPQRTFSALLDELIPARDASLPGAGSLGVGEAIESKLGDAIPLVVSGLTALDAKARERGAADFADLPSEERAPLVGEVSTAHPGFVELLVFHAYTTYYQHPRVAVAIGQKAEPPYPGGFELELGDLGLLDPVRQRGKMYREVST